MANTAHLHHSAESAGRLLTDKIPVVSLEASIADIERLLISKHSQFDSINYIYVIDREGVLQGISTVKNIFRLPKSTRVKDVMTTEIISARASTDQEHVARLALKHNLKAIPVVDKDTRLLGVISSDVILSILYEEAKEDLLLSAGVRRFDKDTVDLHTAPVLIHVKKRLPWLLIGLLGGVGGAFIISLFEEALAAEILLAAFIPPLVYMADAVATQTETIFIQAVTLREKFSLKSYLTKELQISAILAGALSILLSLTAFFWFKSMMLGVVIIVSLFLAIIIASVLAVLLPWLMLKFKRDPAVASGPFATLLTDLLTIAIYFGIAEMVFRFI